MTLVARFGRRFAIAELWLLFAAAYAVPFYLYGVETLGWTVLAPIITLPAAAHIAYHVTRQEGTELNKSLKQSAMLLLAFGLTFAAGIALQGVL